MYEGSFPAWPGSFLWQLVLPSLIWVGGGCQDSSLLFHHLSLSPGISLSQMFFESLAGLAELFPSPV